MSFKPVWNALEGRFDYVLAPLSVIDITVPGSTTQVIDTEPLSSFLNSSYYFRIKRVSDGSIRTFHIDVVNDGGSIKDSLYNKLGPNILVAIDSAASGLNYELSVINSNVSDIEITFMKTEI